MQKNKIKKYKIGIIGLGYVGLPLAIEFGNKFKVFGYDTNLKRINDLKKKNDINKEISKEKFTKSKNLIFTNKFSELKYCNIFIISVPTPIYANKKPNLSLLSSACNKVSSILKKK